MSRAKRPPYVSERPMTYEDYASLPDDGYRYELVDTKLELMSPSPSTVHQICSSTLEDSLKETCSSQYLILQAPLDVIFSATDVRQPDIIMIHRSRMHIVKMRGIFGAPDLVVEILSPGSFKRDRKEKLATYSKYAVPEYWLVDPLNGTLEQYILTSGNLVLETLYEPDETVRSGRIQCASLKMADIMEEIPHLLE